jgi:hypothetical protein
MPDSGDVFTNRHHHNISLRKAGFFHLIIETGTKVEKLFPDRASTGNVF